MTLPSLSEQLPIPTRRGRNKKRFLIGLVILIPACLAVSWLSLADYGRRELARVIADADAEDPDWRLPDLEARGRATVADAENGALVLLAADQLLPNGWPAWPVVESNNDAAYESEVRQAIESSLGKLSPPVQLNDRQMAALRAELQRAAPALDRARQLVDFPKGRYTVNWAPDFIGTRLPHLLKARQISSLLGYDALLRAQEGNVDGALASCRAALNASRSLGDEQMLVSQLVRIACRAIAVRKIERVLAQGQASDKSQAVLQRALTKDAEAPLLYYGVRGERGGFDGFLELFQDGKATISARGLVNTSAFGGQTVAELKALFMLLFAVKSQRAGMLQYMNEVVAAAKSPSDRQRGRLAELEKTVSSRAGIVRLLGPAVTKVAMASDRSRADARTAAVGLAVERYRLANRRWPDSLDDLVPKYLARVPADPFNGKPLRFAPFEQGVVVYSVGPDGVDNHGNISAAIDMTPGPDIGFRLWNPQQRRQAPRPFQMPPRPGLTR